MCQGDENKMLKEKTAQFFYSDIETFVKQDLLEIFMICESFDIREFLVLFHLNKCV